jgi:hypothetical protein
VLPNLHRTPHPDYTLPPWMLDRKDAMTTIFDAVDVAAIPANASVILAYIDGGYRTYNAVTARFPKARVLTITTTGLNKADICDVESQDATPAIAARGVRAGLYRTVYSDRSTKPALDAALAGLQWDWYAAAPGSPAKVIAGSIATQYAWPGYGSPGNYDVSVCLDSWLNGSPAPGPAPSPVPPTPPTPSAPKFPSELFAMLASDPGFAVRFLYRFALHREVDGAGFAANMKWLAAGGDLNTVLANLQDSGEGQAVIKAERKLLGI